MTDLKFSVTALKLLGLSSISVTTDYRDRPVRAMAEIDIYLSAARSMVYTSD